MKNFIQSVLKIINNFFKKEESVIGVDIGSSFLKIVQLKKKHGKAVLETYGELALGPYAGLEVGQATNLPVSKITEALNDLLKESNVTTKNSALSIPLSASLLSVIEMPELDNKQLAKMIPVEARKYIPVPITEVTLDWWIVPKTSPSIGNSEISGSPSSKKSEKLKSKKRIGKVEVLIVAIHNDVVSKYQEIVNAIGLQNTFFELEVFSTIRATFGSHSSSVMVLDLGSGSTKLAVVEYGIIKNQHIINKGSQDITVAISKALDISTKEAERLKKEVGLLGSDDEKKKKVSKIAQLTVDHIFSEVSRILLTYQREYNKNIGQVILSGGGALLKGVYEFSSKQLETEVVFADPFSKVDTPAFLEPVLKDAGPEFAVSLGLALRKLQELD